MSLRMFDIVRVAIRKSSVNLLNRGFSAVFGFNYSTADGLVDVDPPHRRGSIIGGHFQVRITIFRKDSFTTCYLAETR